MISRIRRENSLGPDEIELLINEPKPVGEIEDLPKEAKLELIIDIIRLMKIDNEVHQQEIKFCESISVKLGYNAEVVQDLSCLLYTSDAADE